MNKLIYKISDDSAKVEYFKLVFEALTTPSAREKLHSLLLGLDLK